MGWGGGCLACGVATPDAPTTCITPRRPPPFRYFLEYHGTYEYQGEDENGHPYYAYDGVGGALYYMYIYDDFGVLYW